MFAALMWYVIASELSAPQSRVKRYASSLLIVAAPWIRLTGYFFLAWLILKKWKYSLVLFSLGCWLLLNTYIAGDPLYFLKAQQLFLMSEGGIIKGFTASLKAVAGIGQQKISMLWIQCYLLPLGYFLVLIATGIWLSIKRQWLLAIALFAVLLMSHNQSFWRSAVRYDLSLIPMIAVPLLVWAGSHRTMKRLSLAAFIGMIGFQFYCQYRFHLIFHAGGWAF
jgi:hypothetical protein